MSLIMRLFGLVGFLMDLAYKISDTPLGMCGVMRYVLDKGTTSLATLARQFRGYYYASTGKPLKRPAGYMPITLYEYEGCPFCRKVREVVSALALPVRVYPTPRVTLKEYSVIEGSRYRGEVVKLGGKAMFPYMVDPNTKTSMYESGDIIQYLIKTYGPSAEDLPNTLREITPGMGLWMMLGAAARPLGHMGMLRTPSKLPETPVTFYGLEGHSSSRLVREALTTLELPHDWVPTPIGSPEYERYKKEFGTSSLPTIVDPNTGSQIITGGGACVRYLQRMYKTGDTVKESFSDYSTKGASKAHGTITAKEETKKDK